MPLLAEPTETLAGPRCRRAAARPTLPTDASSRTKRISSPRSWLAPMAGIPSVGGVTSRPSELMLYRCLVCGFNTLNTKEITEHLMSHAEAARYSFAGVVKD